MAGSRLPHIGTHANDVVAALFLTRGLQQGDDLMIDLGDMRLGQSRGRAVAADLDLRIAIERERVSDDQFGVRTAGAGQLAVLLNAQRLPAKPQYVLADRAYQHPSCEFHHPISQRGDACRGCA